MRRVDKPWGHEEIWAETERYAGKFLVIRDGQMLSRQFHERKDESICVLDGVLDLEIGRDDAIEIVKMGPGAAYRISPGTVHRFCAREGDVRLVEVSTPELSDVVRLEDMYNR
jgi:mannose-6-phosphate isomerase